MRIRAIHPRPFHAVPYQVAKGGGRIRLKAFALSHARSDRLPAGCEAVFAASDLQGIASTGRQLGEVVAEELARLCNSGYLPPTGRIGVLLCGDLFVPPALDKSGGTGDVRAVWLAFARRFRWVVGVAGNRDLFGSKTERSAFLAEPNIYLLDGEVCDVGGLRVGGLSGIIGEPDRPQRRREKDFVRDLRSLLATAPDLLLLHQGPDVPEHGFEGHAAVRRVIADQSQPLVMSGHVHWPQPLASTPRGAQLLNLEGRGLLLTAS